MTVLIWLVASIAVLSALTYALMYAPARAQWAAFGALLLGVTGVAVFAPELMPAGMFGLLKFYSVSAAAMLVIAIRYHGWDQKGWACWMAVAVLFVNILEAVGFEAYDWYAGGPNHAMGGNLPNAIAGGLLLVTLVSGRAITIQGEKRDMHYPISHAWLWVYVLWNFLFVYGTNPPEQPTGEWAAFALLHLLTPILVTRARPELFMQARSYSLALAMAAMSVYPKAPLIYTTPEWHARPVAEVLAWISLVAAVGMTAHTFYTRFKQPAKAEAPQV